MNPTHKLWIRIIEKYLENWGVSGKIIREKYKNNAVQRERERERDDYARDNQVISGEGFHELCNKDGTLLTIVSFHIKTLSRKVAFANW
jgi:hypothetical protein